MANLIRRIAALLAAPRGRHRRPAPLPSPAFTAPPPPPDIPLPAHRSPYGLDTPLDGTATVAVRPYVAAHEQRQRRRELALAALGLDLPGSYWIHGAEVA
ncbi:hypothetical protein [Streptomyces sp. NPDC002845]